MATNCRPRGSGDKVAGIDFIAENGSGPGVRHRERQRAKQSK
jgi:hypothetical protein